MKNKILTKGDVIVNDIKVGDIHYEYDLGVGIKVEVVTLPTEDENGNWSWKSTDYYSGKIISYLVNPKYSHYSANLYNSRVYTARIIGERGLDGEEQ